VTLEPLAVEQDRLVNWPPLQGLRLGEGSRDGRIRTQWCHGAPGIVATLAQSLDEELAVAGGDDVPARSTAEAMIPESRGGLTSVQPELPVQASGKEVRK
jgi:hypothetical protein